MQNYISPTTRTGNVPPSNRPGNVILNNPAPSSWT